MAVAGSALLAPLATPTSSISFSSAACLFLFNKTKATMRIKMMRNKMEPTTMPAMAPPERPLEGGMMAAGTVDATGEEVVGVMMLNVLIELWPSTVT